MFNGTLTLTGSTVKDNVGSSGGGIYSSTGSLTITNSTISGNAAIGGGGGINSYSQFTLINSTVSGNTAARAGGVQIKRFKKSHSKPVRPSIPLTPPP